MNFSFQKLSYFLTALLIVLASCGTPYQPEEDPDEKQEEEEEQIEQNDSVPPDGVLETVTWNVEGFGDGTYGSENWGPANEHQQTKNILQVADSLKADLYAFQEVYSQQALEDITENMKGYKGFVAEHIDWKQKMAFAYNTNTINSVETGSIKDVREEYQNDWSYYWAGGRIPLFFRFHYTYEDATQEFYAVVIHGKANTGDNAQEYAEAYKRRKKAAEGLYYYLKDNKPDANIILLGDYNDDVDKSIYYEEENGDRVYQETPYDEFVEDTDNFDVITKKLSDAGESASINYEDIIDHITISDELFDEHVPNSTLIHDPREYIDDYGNTTSDHLPVWAKFDITATSKSMVNK
ncbi:endonuclease/exonuclease/phosphatase family protein [Fodinibius sp. AD559]|uniref:endonuclease/exonuclease/phosphatase family protein n=1 Tax=Fodinibius sp. AD559 TaxID=3424179 RepID=UPI004046FC32